MLFGVVVDDEIDTGIAEITNSIKEDELSILRNKLV
jgi:hypothetical protein